MKYKSYLEVNNEKFEASGKTLEEALLKLKLPQPKTKGVFYYELDGVKSKPTYLNIRQMSILSVPNLTGQIQRAAIIKRMTL